MYLFSTRRARPSRPRTLPRRSSCPPALARLLRGGKVTPRRPARQDPPSPAVASICAVQGGLASNNRLGSSNRNSTSNNLATWQLGNLATWQLGNLATWQLGDLATWRLGDLATWQLGNLATWQLGNLATTGLARFLPKPWWGPREGPSPAGAVRAVRSRVRPPAHLSRDVFPRHFVTETPGNRVRDTGRVCSKR